MFHTKSKWFISNNVRAAPHGLSVSSRKLFDAGMIYTTYALMSLFSRLVTFDNATVSTRVPPSPAELRRSQVSHKTCRFYFVLERTTTTLGDYLRRCLESDLVRSALQQKGRARREGGEVLVSPARM